MTTKTRAAIWLISGGLTGFTTMGLWSFNAVSPWLGSVLYTLALAMLFRCNWLLDEPKRLERAAIARTRDREALRLNIERLEQENHELRLTQDPLYAAECAEAVQGVTISHKGYATHWPADWRQAAWTISPANYEVITKLADAYFPGRTNIPDREAFFRIVNGRRPRLPLT